MTQSKTYVIALVDVQISVHVALVGAVDSTSHAGPRLLKRKHTFNIVAVNLFAGDGVDDDGLNTKKGERSATGFGRGDASKWSDDVGTGLSLPVCLYGC